ncbi:unnamed protein product [Rotaria sordida]|uniref:Uncharacterized protein n=1 Tax=Rotaria sordida TaxID=392033 RepID=A0A815F9M8_9BILA|nr:unnamed protein product [Rotaria sordida]CAF1140989.1 unnamed protein product [Rotaria sordida]CAF1320515.1 unnamed protein product [Rotaria sordida]CAF3536606.1 unnamed protein product [Rotaria sordida]CAF3723730.1 unnamed protein product [Rotaria sordida]
MSSSHSEVRIVENPNELYEYSNNVRPPHKPIPATSHSAKLHEETSITKDISLDFLKNKVGNIRDKPGGEHVNRSGTLIGNSKNS